MPENSTRIYRFNPPGGMPPESFNRLLLIGGIIAFLFVVSMALQGTSSLIRSLFQYIFLVPIILLSLTVHEYSHAMMADFLGDPTPRRMGRLSLNPLRHLDITGTLLLFFAGFGWAKPVLVDPTNFRIPKRAMVSVALAGPLSNVVLAILGAAGYKLLAMSLPTLTPGALTVIMLATMLQTLMVINISLALFNLLPFPPLDGSRIVAFFMPARYSWRYRQFEQIAPMILLLLFALGGLGIILSPMINYTFTSLLNLFNNPLLDIQLYLQHFKGAGTTL